MNEHQTEDVPDVPQVSWWRRTFGMRCKEASALVSQSMDRQLTGTERFFLGAHLCACQWCRRYRAQTRSIHDALQDWSAGDAASTDVKLSVDARKRMAEKISEDS